MGAASFLSIFIPILALIILAVALRRDPKRPSSGTVRTLPKSDLSRQVWKATKPAQAARRVAAEADGTKPAPKAKFAPLTPEAQVKPFRPPKARDRRGA